MFRFSNQLQFPAINLTEDSHLDKARVYSLDWHHIDAVKEKHWLNTRQCSPSPETFQGTIPDNYKVWMASLRFAISQSLLEEIRHCSLRASEEWDRRKPEIRWEPLPTRSPAVAYIQKAFNVLADCLYDINTKNYSREGIKSIVPYALAYRFWCHQTKADNLLLYTGLDDLKITMGSSSLLDNFIQTVVASDGAVNAGIYNAFIDSVEKHIQSIRNSKKVEKASVNEVTAGTLRDFIQNKKVSVQVNDTTLNLTVNIRDITLMNPKLSRSKGTFLTAEINKIIPPEYLGISVTNNSEQFILQDESCKVKITKYNLIKMSGTPPPIITLRIDAFSIIEDEPEVIFKAGEGVPHPSKLNYKEQVQEIVDDSVKGNPDFNGVRIEKKGNRIILK